MTYHENVNFTSIRKKKRGGGWEGRGWEEKIKTPNLEVTVYILCMGVRSAVGKLKKEKSQRPNN